MAGLTPDLTVALVGFGYAGRTFHAPLIGSVPGLRLATIVSSRGDEVMAAYPSVRVVPSLDAALDSEPPDVVVVATPTSTHADIARRALDAGRHVIVDKPLAADFQDARDLSSRAAARGVVLSVFHNRRWDADFLTLQQVTAAGLLGEPMYVASHFDRYRPTVRDRWRERAGPGAGLWFDLGSHLVDQALHLFGEPAAIWADLTAQRPGSGATDYFHVVLFYPGERRVVLHGSSLVAAPGPRFVVHGTRGSFTKHGLDTQEEMLVRGVAPGAAGWGIDPVDPDVRTVGPDGLEGRTVKNVPGDYRTYYAAVRDTIRSGAPNPVSPAEASAVVRVLDAAVASSRAACAVTLAPDAPAALP